MAAPVSQQALFTLESTVIQVNGHCQIRGSGELRVVVVRGLPFAHFVQGNRAAEALAMVNLIELGHARQCEIARALGCSDRTVRRQVRRYEEGGHAALGRRPGYPRGRPRLPEKRRELIEALVAEGASRRQIAAKLGVDEKAIRKQLRRLGWSPARPVQTSLRLVEPAPKAPETAVAPADPNVSAGAHTENGEELVLSLDVDPAYRSQDRMLARFGLLMDAKPLFRPGERVAGAGVLLAIPGLLSSGVVQCGREVYGGIGPAFYGLRTSLVTLVLMALLRIKHPEWLKERPPGDLGRALGLDRVMEVKSMRRKLRRLAALGRAVEFGRALARRRVARLGSALGFLYVDGHVRVYHGKRELPKAHVARMRLAMPATTDYWVNDERGDPLLVVTAPANAGLVKMLPEVLSEVRALVGPRRTTVVFDRGGFSPRLFAKLIAGGFDILTYRKGRWTKLAKSRFHEQKAKLDGREVKYLLADQKRVQLGTGLKMRQVTRLSKDGHQTPVLTTRQDLTAIEVACRMFGRWRQENFFKYLRAEYALDALVDYDTDPDDAEREVPNPAWNKLDAELKKARAELTSQRAEYGLEALQNVEAVRRTMRGFKIANATQGQKILRAMEHYVRLHKRRDRLPRRVPVRAVTEGEVVKLAAEKKHLTDLLKMVAYQVEGELARQIAPHYVRAEDEGRSLIRSALASAADIEVSEEEIHVRLAPFSAPRMTRAVAALCEELNQARAVFPGTRQRLRYSVEAADAG